MAHTFIPRILEAMAGGSLIGQPDLQSKFQACQSYIVRLCLNKEKGKKKRRKIERKKIHTHLLVLDPLSTLKESRITCLGNDAAYSGLDLPMVINIINISTHRYM